MKRFLTRAAVLACALALAGCYAFSTAVPAIPEASRLAESPIAPGLYCVLSVDLSDEALVKEIEIDDCGPIDAAADGRALVPSDDDDASPAAFDAAALGRGVYLMQGPAEDGVHTLGAVRVSENGFAILPEPKLAAGVREEAAQRGVVIDGVDVAEAGSGGVAITEGAPEAVLETLELLMGRWLDAALRDPDEFRRVIDDAIYYVRVDADPETKAPDMQAVRAEVERLRMLVRVSMTLE